MSYSDLDGNGSLGAGEMLSNTDYYPMGMVHSGEYLSGVAANYPYKFQGKELQREGNVSLYDFGSRMYDPTTGRWFNTDPQNQFHSPYLAMGNNWVMLADPDGEFAFVPILVGAAIGVLSNGAMNAFNGQGFFQGGIQAALFGALGGGVSAGIGSISQSLASAGWGQVAVGAFQVGAHGLSRGLISSMQGGNFWHGFASGSLSSGVSSGVSAINGGAAAQWFAGGLSGGIGSSIAGGNLWQGMGQGLITGGLNHAAHQIMQVDPPYKYNGKTYESKEELYIAILSDQAAEQFGIIDMVALAAILDNQGYLSKRFQMEGASKGTS